MHHLRDAPSYKALRIIALYQRCDMQSSALQGMRLLTKLTKLRFVPALYAKQRTQRKLCNLQVQCKELVVSPEVRRDARTLYVQRPLCLYLLTKRSFVRIGYKAGTNPFTFLQSLRCTSGASPSVCTSFVRRGLRTKLRFVRRCNAELCKLCKRFVVVVVEIKKK